MAVFGPTFRRRVDGTIWRGLMAKAQTSLVLAGAVGQTVVLTNVLLDVPGVVPVWLAGYFMSSWPMAALGRTEREPTETTAGWWASSASCR